ncbi:MAG: hypothetical protein U9Q67_04090 [Patescibacteria group bacterium]|nr:hypothetical protein [Patescibacteria group bacterium]
MSSTEPVSSGEEGKTGELELREIVGRYLQEYDPALLTERESLDTLDERL